MRPASPTAPRSTKFPVEITVPIRFRDVDMMGHVNNAVFITLMEQARVMYVEQLPGQPFSKLRFPIRKSYILASIQCDFKAPVKLGQTVNVRVGVTQLGTTSFRMAYELREASSGALVATGTSVQVLYDYQAGTPLPIPEALRRQVATIEGWPA